MKGKIEDRMEQLCEKFKDRRLKTELEYCYNYPKHGCMSNADEEYYQWLCYSALKRIQELEAGKKII